jgi:macrolide transport system ATP-binding/permease protein
LPDEAAEFIFSSKPYAGQLRSMLSISTVWIDRWNTLSHGERKRFQIGISLWLNPDILALDEPTNHIDSYGRNLLLEALLTYKGVGIIVSHDRMLLDSLCSHCLFMRSEHAVMHNGGFSKGNSIENLNDATRENRYAAAMDAFKKIERAARILKHRESAKKNALSKRNIAKHDHDAKRRIDVARISGKDKQSGRKVRLLENRTQALKLTAMSHYFKHRQTDGILFEGEVLSCDRLCFLEEQQIYISEELGLQIPDLMIQPDDRIAITGNNGVGKSVLISHIVKSINFHQDRLIYIPQEVASHEWNSILQKLSGLDNIESGLLFTAIHRLGSEPDRILASKNHSPGEKRKIMLGLGLLKKPGLIIMDEPTNHMDIPSIQCLEDALHQFKGAIIIASHDRLFLEHATHIEWNIEKSGRNSKLCIKM